MSHWQFAYDYFTLSYRTNLSYNKKPVETNKNVLDFINVTISIVTVILTAAACLTSGFGSKPTGRVLLDIVNAFLIVAVVLMCFSLGRLINKGN